MQLKMDLYVSRMDDLERQGYGYFNEHGSLFLDRRPKVQGGKEGERERQGEGWRENNERKREKREKG